MNFKNTKLMLLTAVFSVFSYVVQAQYLSARDIYKYAKSRNYNALSRISGYIDTQDGSGNTALCLAAIDNDYQTYNLLRRYGANPQPYCLQSAMAASGSSTFLGMGATGWLVTGVIVAGGVGIAAGGGGGGGSADSSSSNDSSPSITCINGSISNGQCQCNDGWTGDTCNTAKTCSYNTTSCASGYEETGNTCKSGNIIYKECRAKTVPDGYTKNPCGNGYTQVDTFLSGADTYYKCEVNACPMDSTTSTSCPSGYLAVHTGEYSGNQGCFRCVANECSGYQSSCENGYHATTDTCLSGSKTMYKCEINDCSAYQTSCGKGYNATQSCLSGTTPYYTCTPKKVPAGYTSTPCGNGYTQVDTFLSGTQTYYKCKVNACTGYVTSCGNGYHTTSDTCQSGTTTMYKCEANACTGYVDGCSSGYHATTDTCLSGTKTKVKCEVNDCSTYQTSCGEGYNATQSCLSGTTPYYTCTPKKVPAGYTSTPCGNGYTQIDTFLSGTQTYYKCEVNACTGYVTGCGNGYHTTSDTCQSGATTMYKCEANACTGYVDGCSSGYHATTDTCLSGTKTKVKCEVNDCSAYQTSCDKGYDATQSCLSGNTPYYTCTPKGVPAEYTATPCGEGYYTKDTFLSGTTPYYLCVANSCPGYVTGCGNGYHATSDTCKSGTTTMYICEANACEGYTSSCNDGYHTTTDTCLSGKTTMYKCEPNNCKGYDYTTCPNGFESSGTCLSGTITKHQCAPATCLGYVENCDKGYHTTSDTCLSGKTTMYKCEANTCDGYDYTTCPNGYTSFDTCLSGNTTKHKCKPTDCSKYETSCGEGYNAIQSCLSGSTPYYTCQPKDVPAEYQAEQCGDGYNTASTFLSGETIYYLCEPVICDSQYKSSCADGYRLSETDTCKSGENILAVCEINVCDEIYKSSCDEGYHLSTTDVCQTGETKLALCEANTCIGYPLNEVPTNCIVSDSCKTPTATLYKCNTCSDGYTGTTCSTCATGYGKDNNGLCVKKQADVVGRNVNNSILADIYGTKTSNNNGTITLINSNNGDVYGVYSANNANIEKTNSASGSALAIAVQNKDTTITETSVPEDYSDNVDGTIDITNAGDGNVYGIYNGEANARALAEAIATAEATAKHPNYNITTSAKATATVTSTVTLTSKGKINILNNGNGNVYGMYGSTIFNAVSTATANASATAEIIYYYPEKVSARATAKATAVAKATGSINIINNGNGNTYGMFGSYRAYSTEFKTYYPQTSCKCYRTSLSSGGSLSSCSDESVSYGIRMATASASTDKGSVSSNINIVNNGSGYAYGMYAPNAYNVTNSNITMANTGDGVAVGMHSSYATNSDTIIIHNLGTGTAVGMYVLSYGSAENSGSITIDRASYQLNGKTYTSTSAQGSVAIGIYGESGSTIKNDGEIIISGANTTYGIDYGSQSSIAIGIYGKSGSTIKNDGEIIVSGADTAYGIYAESGATVTSSGTITIDGNTDHANKIVLNGSTLFLDGALIVINNTQNSPMSVSGVQPASLNLNDFGGTVIASDTSQFIVEGEISGDLAINNSVIENGFDTTYSVKDMIQAEDTSGLNLQSQSALFNATLENNTDAVMTMKAFNDMVENSSVADFLQNNYAANNNEDLFKTLKSAETVAQLNSNIDDLFGKNMLSRMAFEDLSMLREVSFDMNNHLFEKKGAFEFGGNISPSSYDNNIGSVGRYSLNGYNNGKTSFGLGISITDLRTDDGHSDNRRFDRNFMMSMPIGHKTHGFELITAPKVGYADGTYDRDGFNNMTYEGKIQKRMFALMNQARYPLKFGGMKLVPSAEFNMIGYNIKGHEDDKQYALRIKSQNHYSVEAGFGLMAEKEFKPFKNHKFNVNGGVAVYHEFANPYELDVAMNGMSGTYCLQDEKRSDNRAVVRFGFGYEFKDNVDVSASWITNIDREYRTDANIDLKYHF